MCRDHSRAVGRLLKRGLFSIVGSIKRGVVEGPMEKGIFFKKGGSFDPPAPLLLAMHRTLGSTMNKPVLFSQHGTFSRGCYDLMNGLLGIRRFLVL